MSYTIIYHTKRGRIAVRWDRGPSEAIERTSRRAAKRNVPRVEIYDNSAKLIWSREQTPRETRSGEFSSVDSLFR